MATYVITGGSSGIGLATKEILTEQGHRVFNIDYQDGDLTVDLSTPVGRKRAVTQVFKHFPDGIDGLICNAGVGPEASPECIFALNFFSAIYLAEKLKPLLAKRCGTCCMTGCNAVSQENVSQEWSDLLINGLNEEQAMMVAARLPQDVSTAVYASSKNALARWVRRSAAAWGSEGMRINVVAPGFTETPMLKNMSEQKLDMSRVLPTPTFFGQRTYLAAQEIASCISFLCSIESTGVNGAVLYIDGGIDAMTRSEHI